MNVALMIGQLLVRIFSQVFVEDVRFWELKNLLRHNWFTAPAFILIFPRSSWEKINSVSRDSGQES